MASAHARGIRVALPLVVAKGTPLVFREWHPRARLEPGVWNIPVPADGPEVIPAVEPSCQTGGCGMCVTAYVEGDIIHKDGCLSVADRERYVRIARKDADRPGPVNGCQLSTMGST